MLLTEQELQQIREEAEVLYPNYKLGDPLEKIKYDTYTAAVTAEREKFHKTINGLYTETVASMLLTTPDGDYKKGFNNAMQKVLNFIDQYKNGKGLFQ